MSQQISTANNQEIREESEQHDFTLYGSPVQIRPNRARKSVVKMVSEDQQHTEQRQNHTGKLIRMDARRGSSFIRALSEDMQEDLKRLDLRRGSSFFKPEDDSSRSSSSSRRSFLRSGDETSEDSFRSRRGSSFLRAGNESNPESARSPKDIRRGSSFIRTTDDSLEDNPLRRRASSMLSEDISNEDKHRSDTPDSRRSSGVSSTDDSSSRRSSKSDSRRGSKEQETEGDISVRNNSYRHSLESITEYKTKTFSSATVFPLNIEYSMTLQSPTSERSSSDFAQRSDETDTLTERTFANSSLSYLSWIESVNNSEHLISTSAHDGDNRSGEWNSFWSNYNNSSSRNEYFSSPYLCPSNSGEDLSMDGSNASTPRGYTDKSINDTIAFTTDEVNEAIHCTERLLDILKSAMKRFDPDMTESKHSEDNNKDDKLTNNGKDKNALKSTSSSCIDMILNHTGMADILKKVINKRREIIMPSDESSTSRSSLSDWSIKK